MNIKKFSNFNENLDIRNKREIIKTSLMEHGLESGSAISIATTLTRVQFPDVIKNCEDIILALQEAMKKFT